MSMSCALSTLTPSTSSLLSCYSCSVLQTDWLLFSHPMSTLDIIYQYNMWAPPMRGDMRVSWVWPAVGRREGCSSVVCCVPGSPLTPGSHHHSLTLHPAKHRCFCHLVCMDSWGITLAPAINLLSGVCYTSDSISRWINTRPMELCLAQKKGPHHFPILRTVSIVQKRNWGADRLTYNLVWENLKARCSTSTPLC